MRPSKRNRPDTGDELPNDSGNLPDSHAAPSATATEADEALALEAFGKWMDGELEKLVARWAHLAAPAATRAMRLWRGQRR